MKFKVGDIVKWKDPEVTPASWEYKIIKEQGYARDPNEVLGVRVDTGRHQRMHVDYIELDATYKKRRQFREQLHQLLEASDGSVTRVEGE